MMLTEHFSMDEFIVSETARRRGVDNTPQSAQVRANILRTAMLMERIRALLGVPVIITSGYRCPELNRAVGGSANSAHMVGLAADFIASRFGDVTAICRAIEPAVEDLGIDQLIHEFGAWVHVGLRDAAPRHQVLTIDAAGARVGLS